MSKVEKQKFIPESFSHFNLCVRGLCWYLGLSTRDASMVLRKAYGFDSKNALVSAINSEASGPFTNEMGWSEINESYEIEDVRNRQLLAAINHKTRQEYQTLRFKHTSVFDLGFFSRQEDTQVCLEKARLKWNIFSGCEQDGQYLGIDDYATAEQTGSEPAIFRFTALGQGLFDVVDEMIGQIDTIQEYADDIEDIETVVNRHAQNPWLKALLLGELFESMYQDSWSGKIDFENNSVLDITHDFKKYAKRNAERLLPLARQTLALFEYILGENKDNVAHYKTRRYGYDAFSYPATLFYAGKIALNLGEMQLAQNWLKRNYRLVETDNFGARDYLAVIALNEKSGSAKVFYNKDYCDMWGHLAIAGQEAGNENLKEAKTHFLEAILASSCPFEHFSGMTFDTDIYRNMGSSNSIACFKEFMHYSEKFWRQHPNVSRFFSNLVLDDKVVRAYKEYLGASKANIGCALKGIEEMERLNHKRSIAVRELKKVF